MKTHLRSVSSARPLARGFTLAEVMISMSVCTIVMGMCMGTFILGLKMMHKDNVRLATNTSLRYFTSQMAKETVDSSEFYLLPDYTSLDGSVDIDNSDGTSDMPTPVDDGNGTMLASGDCIILVTRTSVADGAKVRQFRIYFRVCKVADVSYSAPIRYYESQDYGTAGTNTALGTLLNAVNLNSNTTYTKNIALQRITSPSNYALAGHTNRRITLTAKGRRIGTTTNYYPIFCSEGPVVTATNESFSINVEFINGTAANNMLSSSSFNYTVSPRR
jgi:prepilin-type N-terminal cleavage/methylation domain-containing protein